LGGVEIAEIFSALVIKTKWDHAECFAGEAQVDVGPIF
jgi:hypothetical protein